MSEFLLSTTGLVIIAAFAILDLIFVISRLIAEKNSIGGER